LTPTPEKEANMTRVRSVTLTLHHTGKLPREAMGHNWVPGHNALMRGTLKFG
jgi:azurin